LDCGLWIGNKDWGLWIADRFTIRNPRSNA
jgi:hypothetical protein